MMNKNLPIPKNEVSRLDALAQYNILDTLPEEEFDRLTQLASIICGVPIALISLIDKDRQWFKSKIGLNAPETPRDISFCQYTINGESLFEIEDATKDERFLSNPLVTDQPNIRFYAGHPLIDPDGYALGSLCVIDREARKLTSDQRRVLTLLANEVVSQIVSRKKNAEKDKLEKMFDLSIDLICVAGTDGYFKKLNPAFTLTLGWTIEELLAKPFYDFIHPDDVTITYNEIKKLATGEKTINFENRFITKNGDYLSINWVANPDEITGELYAIARDITERKKAEAEKERLLSILQKSLNEIYVFNADTLQFEYVNEGALRNLGYSMEEMLEMKAYDIKPELTMAKFNELIAPLINHEKEKIVFETIHERADSSLYPVEVHLQLVTRAEQSVFLAIILDITKRKQTEIALLENMEELEDYKFALDQSAIIAITDKNGIIKTVNDKFCAISQFSREELVGNTHKLINSKFHPKAFFKELWDTISSGKIWRGLIKNKKKNGEYYWVDTTIIPFLDANNKPFQYLAIRFDVTEIKTAQDEIIKAKELAEQSEAHSRLIMDSSLNAIITIDVNGRITFWNKRAEIIFGWKNGEVFGKSLSELIIPHQYIEAHNKGMKHYLKTGDGPVLNTQIEITALNKAGDEFPIEMAIVPLKRNDEQFFSAFIQDISSRKKEELLRKVLQEKYQNIIANMNLGLLEVDIDEKIQYANQQFCNMSGYELDELLGKKASDLFVREESRKLIESKNESRKKSVSDAYEVSVSNKWGEHRWWLISGAPNYNDKGELIGSIGIHLDITEQKKLELELVEAKNNAEASTQAKEIFLANMSHEIRTPMNAIMGMSNQLAKTPLENRQKLYLNTIISASDNLLIIINDILDLSKIEAGKLALEHIAFEPHKVIGEVMHVMMYKAEEKGILFTNSYFDSKISSVLIGDPFRLNQVILNLTSNAIKFTEKGEVDIACKVIEDKANSQRVKVTVKDTGIGMEGSFVKQMFEKFSQEYKSGSRKFGGTGLGMSISKDLVELMGGEIDVESKKGQGTSISIILELEKGDFTDLIQNEVVQISNDFLSGKKIVVADDNDHNRLIASIILHNYGAEIYEAVNGQEALVAIDKYKADLVLMDIQMPVLNGYEATKMIRENGNEIPVIAMTANAIKGENENCIAAGMNDYISKPFKEEDFLRTIAKWIVPDKNLNENNLDAANNPQVFLEQLYDLETIKAFSRGNESFIQKMINLFCEQTPLQVEEMINAYHANDLGNMGAIAHKIKPSIDNFNISLLKQDIRTIEEAGKENRAIPELKELLEKTKNTVLEVIHQLKQHFPD